MSLFGPPNIGKMKAGRDVEGLVKALTYNYAKITSAREDFKKNPINVVSNDAWRKLRALISELSAVSREAAQALGELGDARAVEPLFAVFPVIPEEAAEALGKIKDTRAVDLLCGVLKSDRPAERIAAARALGSIGDARAVEPLLIAFDHTADADIRTAVAEALGRLKDARAIERLVPLLKHREKELAESAAAALVSIGAPTTEALVAALQDQDWNQRRMAATVLERLGWRPAAEQERAWQAVARCDWEACARLGASVVAPLGAVLGNKSEQEDIRTQAVQVLKDLGSPEALDVLASVYDVDLTENRYGDTPKRVAAIKAMQDLGSPRAVEILITTLEDWHSSIRQEAAQALANLYRSNRLDEASKRRIVSARNRITKRHTDKEEWDSKCEMDVHTDSVEGVDIDFGVKDAGPSAAPVSIGANASQDLDSIAAVLAGGDQAACMEACMSLLGMRADPHAVEILIQAMTFGHNGGLFGTTLGMMGAERVVQPLIAALGDKDEKLRQVASSVIGFFNDARAIEPLAAALKDENEIVRVNARGGLEKLAQSENESVRQAAKEALGKVS